MGVARPLDTGRHMRRAVVLICLAMFALACMDAISKHLAQTYPISQMLAVRFWMFSGFALLLCRGRIREALRTSHLGLQLLRGIVITFEVAVFVLAFKHLPLADAHAVAGIAPLLVTALAVPFLGERVGWRRWLAVAGGFAGLLIILRPGLAVFDSAALIPLIGALLWAIYQLLVRRTSDDSPSTLMLYMALIGAIVMSAIAPFYWITPDVEGWCFLFALGFVGSLGHWLLILALRAAPASQIQPFNYTVIVWAAVLGALIFEDLPDAWTVTGAAVIIASGTYAWYREQRSVSTRG